MTIKDTRKEWTVMVYMAGDNNLSPDRSYAMERIRAHRKQDMGAIE
mgnify:FL=1